MRRRNPTTLQSFVLKKRAFTLRDAITFARRHDALKIGETRNEYHIRIKSPASLKRQGFTRLRRFSAAPGIDLIIGAKGRASNPPRGTVGMIPGEAEKMFYHRYASRHPGPYQHGFGPGAVMFAMRGGDVLLHSTTGKKLWGRY